MAPTSSTSCSRSRRPTWSAWRPRFSTSADVCRSRAVDNKSGRPSPPKTGSGVKPPAPAPATFRGFSPTHRSRNTGTLFQVLDVVEDLTHSRKGKKMVVFRTSLGVKYVRDADEFMDGRYEEVTP